MLWPLQGVASRGGQGANTCDRCATNVGFRRCTWIHRRAAPAGLAWPCEGFCASSMRRCNASSSVRLRGPAGGSGQGHAATSEQCAHLLALIGAAEDIVSHSLQRWLVCGELEAGNQGSRHRSQRSSNLWRTGSRSSSKRARTRHR